MQAAATFPCASLDLIEAAHRDRVYPLMYAHIKLLGNLDEDRLVDAVTRSSLIVPELLCAYDFAHNCFAQTGCSARDVVTRSDCERDPVPDLAAGPQLRIDHGCSGSHAERVTLALSHLLADGAGFLQYLYLLCDLYNGRAGTHGENHRELPGALPRRAAPQHRHANQLPSLRKAPSPMDASDQMRIVETISAEATCTAREHAHDIGATLNDVLMTAYGRIIASELGVNEVVLPCPADLRRVVPSEGTDDLTIANMTGSYQHVTIERPCDGPFGEALRRVSKEMRRQKRELRCLDGVRVLHSSFHKVPRRILTSLVRAAYHPAPISYSNIGIVDDARLRLDGCTVESCYLTGTYRVTPDFQLTTSTFRGACTLSCTMLGTEDDCELGQRVLAGVADEIRDWAKA